MSNHLRAHAVSRTTPAEAAAGLQPIAARPHARHR